jgi:hypothetical protein
MLGLEMSAPNEIQPDRSDRRRRWWTGAAVTAVVLVVALAVLALLPRSTTATASLTVTPRTDAGADAALLLADRYTALAGSAGTLRAAREDEPALADVPLDELQEGTAVERAAGAATIAVRVTLADRDAAVAAANAVVDTLVEAGADEDLVDVGRGAEATPSRTDRSPDPVRWTLVAVLLALACGLAAGAVAGRSSRALPTAAPQPPPALPPAADDTPEEVLDDLPGFLENPPGSLPALPAAAPTGPVSAPVEPPQDASGNGATARTPAHAAGRRTPAPVSRSGAVVATVTAVVVLVAVAVLVGITVGRSDDAGSTAGAAGPVRPTGPAATLTAPTESAAPGLDATVPTTSAPASATETAAAALAFESVPLGENGVAASVTFEGVVLEQRAVGLTVTYPSVSVTSDGRRSLAHVRLPTFNCLTPEPPADPVAAGCARSLTEYADLTDPQLQVARDGDRIDLVGLFPTYTRPNGTAPGYTGRAYQLTAAITADGTERDGTARDGSQPGVTATGVVRIGLNSAATTADPRVNLLLLPH